LKGFKNQINPVFTKILQIADGKTHEKQSNDNLSRQTSLSNEIIKMYCIKLQILTALLLRNQKGIFYSRIDDQPFLKKRDQVKKLFFPTLAKMLNVPPS